MAAFLIRRSFYALLSLILLSATIFLLVRVAGDPAVLLAGPGSTTADIAALRESMGLNKSLWDQYSLFLSNLVAGDFGVSYFYKMPVIDLYMSRLPNSIVLAAVALAFSLVVGIPVGVLAAVKIDGWWDRFGKLFALLGVSLPGFWVSLILILVFSVYLRLLPSSGAGTFSHLIMPAFALGWYFAAAHMRLTRSSMIEVMNSEYIKLARLKGLPEWMVIGKHALKNALIPVVTLAGVNLVLMINAAVVIETVFAWPGIGRLLYEGISQRDFPVVQAIILLSGAMIIAVNLVVDLLYALIDPRIRIS